MDGFSSNPATFATHPLDAPPRAAPIMTAPTLRPRILAALQLQPMTHKQLCLTLSASERWMRVQLWGLVAAGKVRARGRPYRYELKTLSTEEKQS